MRPRTLLILASLVAVLGAFIWFVERDLPSTEEQAERDKKVIVLEETEVERVVIEYGGPGEGTASERTVIELVRDPVGGEADEAAGAALESWRLVRPVAARADRQAIKSLVSRLVDLEKERTLEGVGRDDIGLASPRAQVTLATSDGETTLEIGADVPASKNMTLAVAGRDEFYVVSNSVLVDLTRPPGEWRDLRLFVGESSGIQRVTLRRQDELVELVDRGTVDRGTEFWVETPLADRADETGVNALLSELDGLSAERFLGAGEAERHEMGLNPPVGTIEVHLAGQEQPLTIEIGGFESQTGNPTRFARVDSELVTLAGELVTHLERPASEWRSRKWATSKVLDITRALVSDGLGEVEIRREEGGWLRDGQKLTYGPATDLLYELTGAEADTLEASQSFEPGEPEVTVQLESDLGEPEVLTLYAARGDQVPARSSSREGTLFLLAPEAAQGVTGKIEALRAAALAVEEAIADGS